MNILCRYWIWLRRVGHCKGFGIQSPKDYAFVTEVINEHWPYYAYETIKEKDWKKRKLGRLYLRLANWRQPTWMEQDEYEEWWKAGAHPQPLPEAHPQPLPEGRGETQPRTRNIELGRMDIAGNWEEMAARCDGKSVVVVENIYRNWRRWHEIEHDGRVGTTFDLYYCGIVWFDKERFGHHYKVNF